MSCDNGRSITYTVFDKAERIHKGSQSTEFSYGLGNRRYKRVDDNAVDQQKTTWTVGSVEWIEGATADYFKRYIGGVAIVDYYPASQETDAWYLTRDHLGSIHSISNANGVKVEESHFGPWGARQGSDWQSPLAGTGLIAANAFTTRGFTGHEHADALGVIHMNGRIYDSRLGRFLQADPFVQAPRNGQSLNRYSYALNNPLSYTDTSGYFFKRLIRKWGRVIVAAVAAYFTWGLAYGAAASAVASGAQASFAFAQFVSAAGWQTLAGIAAGAASGFVAGAILTGSLRGATKSAFAGAITGGVAKGFGNTYNVNRVVVDSVAGGTISSIYGESFKDGFLKYALVSSLTLINVKLQLHTRRNSAKTPYQIADLDPHYRGMDGSVSGGRLRAKAWIESRSKELVDAGLEGEWVIESVYKPFLKEHGIPFSPLGGVQGSKIKRFLFWDFNPNGGPIQRLAHYVQEGWGGQKWSRIFGHDIADL